MYGTLNHDGNTNTGAADELSESNAMIQSDTSGSKFM